MKSLIRGMILLAGAGSFCIALALSAQADVVTPRSAYQPASVGLLQKGTPATADVPGPAKVEADKAKADMQAQVQPVDVIPATPAPEQVVRRVPAPVMLPDAAHAPSAADRVTQPLRVGMEHIRASLGRVVSACEVGFGTGAGGPVLVLGVLSMAIPFIRRRVFATRWATDEVVPEFLYAGELTPPG